MQLLTGWESFHWRNNSFQEHNTLFSADMQPCLFYTHNNRPSDRVQKKMENYAKIFGNIMWKKVRIMQKRRQIMQKFLKLNKVVPLAFSNV